MKKICVVTWSGGINYGTNLQAFALIKKLELLGYDAKLKGRIIGNFNYFLHPLFVVRKILNKLKNKFFIRKQESVVIDLVRKRKFKLFFDQYLPKLNCYGMKEWRMVEEEYLAFITGSDQVWNPNYFQDTMMLDFIVNGKIKKIAYAPSIGINILSKKIRAKYKRLLSSYVAIGVRETQAAKLIEDISPVSVKVVLDPTLLLTQNDWDLFIESADIEDTWKVDRPYILCYFVGERNNYSDYVNLVKKNTGLNCIIIPMNIDISSTCNNVAFGVGPKEFIWLIKNASIVCTDSFHATVFSIIFQREFYVLRRFIDNPLVSQNGRLYEILDEFKLYNRLVTDERVFQREQKINYDNVFEILNEKRKYSEKFLITSLER